MKLYLAWYSTGKKYLPKLNIANSNYLETYLVFKNKNMAEEYAWSKKKRFLDSWAFTAFTLWRKIDIQEYIEFVKKNKQYFELYANLDVIGDYKATDRNQKIMEEAGLKPLPTYHMWEPREYFEELVERYQYIGLWGLVPYARQPKKIEAMLNYCFHYVMTNNKKTKFHWRGMTNPLFMKKYPFYSVDSTGWLAWGKFKTLLFFEKGSLKSMNAADIRKKYWRDWWVKHHEELNTQNIKAMYQYVSYLTTLHQIKGMEYRL